VWLLAPSENAILSSSTVQARLFAYKDAAVYRLGINHEQLVSHPFLGPSGDGVLLKLSVFFLQVKTSCFEKAVVVGRMPLWLFVPLVKPSLDCDKCLQLQTENL
jgi:hypothetical protein